MRPGPTPIPMREPFQDLPNYPELIAGCRKAAGLSQMELAERANVRPAIIELWENPNYEGIDLSILQRVARATGTTLNLGFGPQAAPLAPAAAEDLLEVNIGAAPTAEPAGRPEAEPTPRPARRKRRTRSRAWDALLNRKAA